MRTTATTVAMHSTQTAPEAGSAPSVAKLEWADARTAARACESGSRTDMRMLLGTRVNRAELARGRVSGQSRSTRAQRVVRGVRGPSGKHRWRLVPGTP